MNIQDIAALIQLREYLYGQVNGLTGLKKDKVRPVQQVISKIDNLIVDAALAADFTSQPSVMVRESNDADFEKSLRIVEAATAKVSVDDKGVVTVSAPESVAITSEVVPEAPAVSASTPELQASASEPEVKQVRAKPLKKRAAFRRSDDSDIEQ